MSDPEVMAETACSLKESACHCVLSDVMGLLGRKYVMDLVCILDSHGTVRFGTFEDHVPGASTSTLSDRLEDLVEAELVAREQYAEIPPRVEYELTDEGEQLAERFRPVAEWAAERAARNRAE
jgi:DNA-binding HxlR family transcriptional regulator